MGACGPPGLPAGRVLSGQIEPYSGDFRRFFDISGAKAPSIRRVPDKPGGRLFPRSALQQAGSPPAAAGDSEKEKKNDRRPA